MKMVIFERISREICRCRFWFGKEKRRQFHLSGFL